MGQVRVWSCGPGEVCPGSGALAWAPASTRGPAFPSEKPGWGLRLRGRARRARGAGPAWQTGVAAGPEGRDREAGVRVEEAGSGGDGLPPTLRDVPLPLLCRSRSPALPHLPTVRKVRTGRGQLRREGRTPGLQPAPPPQAHLPLSVYLELKSELEVWACLREQRPRPANPRHLLSAYCMPATCARLREVGSRRFHGTFWEGGSEGLILVSP